MTTFLDQAEITGTIPQMIDEAEKFVARNIRHGIRIVGFRHVNVHEYPTEAIREAVTNALCHRDWGLVGSQVRVAMQEYNLPLPVFEEPGPNFTVTFYGPGTRFMQELEARPEWTRGLSERQVSAALYAGNQGKITTGEYRDLVGISEVTAYRDLRELCERGLFEKRGRGRGMAREGLPRARRKVLEALVEKYRLGVPGAEGLPSSNAVVVQPDASTAMPVDHAGMPSAPG